MDSLVTTEWLAGEMESCDLRIIDASSHLPTAGRDARVEFAESHIPGAVFMDLASLIDAKSPVPSALPTPEMFSSRMQKLGIGDGSRIVIYDNSDVKTSCRAWFMFKLFGAQHVAVLDGGLAKWRAEQRPVQTDARIYRERHFTAWRHDGKVRTKQDMLANVSSHKEQVIDARDAGRFSGDVPDFRPGVPSGHIPGSCNIPFYGLYNDDGTFKTKAELAALFNEAGINLSQPITTTCGGGVTAACLTFALHLLGKDDVALYDGSWSEWAIDPETPKATGSGEKKKVAASHH